MERKIREAECAAKEIAARLAQAAAMEEAKFLVREYVRTRYFLEEQDLELETFNALGQMSIARLTGMDPLEVLKGDLGVGCDSGSASMTKKILLVIGLNRDLELGISPEESASMKTLSSLVNRVAGSIVSRNTEL